MDARTSPPQSMRCLALLVLCVVALTIGLAWRVAFGTEATPNSAAVGPPPTIPNDRAPSSEATSQSVASRDCPIWPCGDFSREPQNFHPWWEDAALRPLRPENPPLQLELESVVLGTLCFSPQVNMMRAVAPIREDSIVEAQGDFDPRAFVESKFLDTSDPVGSELIAPLQGDRYIDQNWYYSSGIRKKTLTGANRVRREDRLRKQQLAVVYPRVARNGPADHDHHSAVVERSGQGLQQPPDRVGADRRPVGTRSRLERPSNPDARRLSGLLGSAFAAIPAVAETAGSTSGACRFAASSRPQRLDAVGGQLARAKAAVASRYAAVIRQETLLLDADAKLRTLINDP